MSKIEQLKEGQEVFLKRPVQIYAKVIGPRETDLDSPAEQVHYAVQLLPLEQHYLPEDLEISHRPQAQKTVESSKPERVPEPAQLNQAPPNLPANDPFSDLAREIGDLIGRRAYELYLERGSADGHDAEDWLRAKSQILLDVPANITETESQVAVHAEVPGYGEDDLEVLVAPRSMCITGKRNVASLQADEISAGSECSANRIFRVLELPAEIDTERVDASISNGILEVKLLKVGLRKVVPVRARSATA